MAIFMTYQGVPRAACFEQAAASLQGSFAFSIP